MPPVFDIDFTDYDDSGFAVTKEGVYHAEVKEVKVDKSRNGDPMLNVRLIAVANRKTLVFDNIMLAGGGKNIGLGKLIELGVPRAAPGSRVSLDPHDLIGRRLAVAICHEEYEGKPRARVDIRQLKVGYLNEKDAIEQGVVGDAPRVAVVEEKKDTPF